MAAFHPNNEQSLLNNERLLCLCLSWQGSSSQVLLITTLLVTWRFSTAGWPFPLSFCMFSTHRSSCGTSCPVPAVAHGYMLHGAAAQSCPWPYVCQQELCRDADHVLNSQFARWQSMAG